MIAPANANSDQPLLFKREGSIARLTLNRPNAANAIDVALAKVLMEASIICEARAIAGCGRDRGGWEGVTALLAKRKPDFKGNHHG